jgi:hypothetical protein
MRRREHARIVCGHVGARRGLSWSDARGTKRATFETMRGEGWATLSGLSPKTPCRGSALLPESSEVARPAFPSPPEPGPAPFPSRGRALPPSCALAPSWGAFPARVPGCPFNRPKPSRGRLERPGRALARVGPARAGSARVPASVRAGRASPWSPWEAPGRLALQAEHYSHNHRAFLSTTPARAQVSSPGRDGSACSGASLRRLGPPVFGLARPGPGARAPAPGRPWTRSGRPDGSTPGSIDRSA